MAKTTALAEVVEAAERHGWTVKLHDVTQFRTLNPRDNSYKTHDDIVAEILPSEAMSAVGVGDARPLIVLFRRTGAFHTAFRSIDTWDVIEAEAEAAAQRDVYWMSISSENYSEEYIAKCKAFRKAETLYNIVRRSRIALTKTKVLSAIEKHPLHLAERRKVSEAARVAELRAREIERLTQVEANNARMAGEATQEAVAALEEVKAALRGTHPTLAAAPGLVDSIIFALVGESNDPEAHALIRFIHARARIEHAAAERDKAQALLTQYAKFQTDVSA